MPSSNLAPRAHDLPQQLFFASPEQRVALARERFFDDGPRPTGLVSEAVIQSWSRCRSAQRDPRWVLTFDPVSRSGLGATLERCRELLRAALDELTQLESAIAGTATRVLLTDANGVIVHVGGNANNGAQPVLRSAARCGVNLAEAVVGTNAPAVVLKSGEAASVMGAEHYHDCIATLRCVAAPIHDAQGHVAGVLDLSIEARPFAFDAAALVGVYATVISNRLLDAAAGEHLLLAFQVSPSMIGSPLQALAGIDGRGRVAWCNRVARQLLGIGNLPHADAETVLGMDLHTLLARFHNNDAASPLRLPNGLAVWLRARGPLSAAAPSRLEAQPRAATHEGPAVTPPPVVMPPVAASLTGMTRELIDRTVADCGGNLSQAARRLGVSRGLLYRRRSTGAAA